MIKVVVKKEWLNPEDDNKIEKCFRNVIELTDEHGKHIPGVQSIQINLDVNNIPTLVMKTLDFQFEGEFDESEVKKEVIKDEDTPRV